MGKFTHKELEAHRIQENVKNLKHHWWEYILSLNSFWIKREMNEFKSYYRETLELLVGFDSAGQAFDEFLELFFSLLKPEKDFSKEGRDRLFKFLKSHGLKKEKMLAFLDFFESSEEGSSFYYRYAVIWEIPWCHHQKIYLLLGDKDLGSSNYGPWFRRQCTSLSSSF